MKKARKKVIAWNVVCILCWLGVTVVVFTGGYICSRPFFKPNPIEISLPDFQGRILPSDQIKPGTFSVKKDFGEIGNWGTDSILTYGEKSSNKNMILEKNEFWFQAWRPDPLTPGVFEYAEKIYSLPWPTIDIDKVEIANGKIVLFPGMAVRKEMWYIAGGIVSILFLWRWKAWAAEKRKFWESLV